MGEYNYSAPYRGTGAALPEGYLNALMQPGRNIGAGLESAGNAIAEGIGKYYKNKEEKAGAQAAAEGAVAQYLGLSNLPQRQAGQQDEMVRDRYLGQVQDRQKDIMNVVGEKTWKKFQDGKASTPEILGLTHSLGVYDTKKKERQAVDFQRQQLNLNAAGLMANIKSVDESVASSKFDRAYRDIENGQKTSLFAVTLANQQALSKQLIGEIDSNNTLSKELASNPQKPSESQTTYYTRILDGIKTPVPWDVRGKMLSIAQNFDRNMPEVKTLDGKKYLFFNGTQTELSAKSKGNFVQAYTIAGEPMPNMWRDLDTNQLIQPSAVGNPFATAIASQLTDPQAIKGQQEQYAKQQKVIDQYIKNGNNNVPPGITNPTNAIPFGAINLIPGANGEFNFIPKPKQ